MTNKEFDTLAKRFVHSLESKYALSSSINEPLKSLIEFYMHYGEGNQIRKYVLLEHFTEHKFKHIHFHTEYFNQLFRMGH